jgi:hypothetical protein
MEQGSGTSDLATEKEIQDGNDENESKENTERPSKKRKNDASDDFTDSDFGYDNVSLDENEKVQ